MRRKLAILAAATLPLTMVVACGDDDDNDDDIELPDVDPGDGTGLPGDNSIGD